MYTNTSLEAQFLANKRPNALLCLYFVRKLAKQVIWLAPQRGQHTILSNSERKKQSVSRWRRYSNNFLTHKKIKIKKLKYPKILKVQKKGKIKKSVPNREQRCKSRGKCTV